MAANEDQHIVVSTHESICRIRFNRPKKKNAISRAMYTRMADALADADSDNAVRVILLEGSEGCFTSGNDIRDFMNDPVVDQGSPVGRFLDALSTARKPVVVAVTGIAIGIGTTLLLHCDLVYASEKASFHMPFVNLGLVPEFGSSLILPAQLGHRRASELLMLGKAFDAETARECGIINAAVAEDRVVATALDAARALAAQPPAALRRTKALMRTGAADALRARIKLEGEHFAAMLSAPEAIEAFTALLEKREPDFSRFE